MRHLIRRNHTALEELRLLLPKVGLSDLCGLRLAAPDELGE
jgi:hypothetical protein